MRAIIYERYGAPSVLKLSEVAQPPTPGPGQLLIKVAAAGINPKDCLVRKGKFKRVTGQRFPRTPGYDFAGLGLSVEATDNRIKSWWMGSIGENARKVVSSFV